MRLYHRTPNGPQVKKDGFTKCDTPHHGEPVAWFAGTVEETASGKQGAWLIIVTVPDEAAAAYQYVDDWLIIVAVPDEVAAAYQYVDDVGPIPGLYAFPFDVVNGYRPFDCRPWEEPPAPTTS
jgi:hypothetical protein